MSGTALVRYDAMCTAIAAAHAVDEVKEIRNQAVALEKYAQQAQNTEAERLAREIRLRAERKCGELLTDREKAKGGRPAETPTLALGVLPLSDLGITHNQSSQWQKLAAVPEDLFEAALVEPGSPPSTTGIIARYDAVTRPPAPAMNNYEALWLWGRLLDFEREGLLAEDPNELVASMLDHMRITTLKMVPRVISWLERIGK
jgi:hypothetical protein